MLELAIFKPRGRFAVAQSDDSGCAFVFAAAIAAYFLIPTSWTNAVWYGVQYQVNFGDVLTEDKPKDCDFMHAPLGDKGCSYKAHVKAYNARGILVAGEDAPKYARDNKTGRTIWSSDGGKTWNWYGADDLPDTKVASVAVFWLKE